GLPSRDRVLGLPSAVRAATERAQLLGEQHRLVAIGPAQEDALLAQQLDAHRLLGGGCRGSRRAAGRAGIARAGPADRPVGKDAVVPVAPLNSQRVAPDLLQATDARALGHGSR